ncbi:MAG: hypothetical protein U5O39_12680 [Gammaproteobacteria bacterium]|nr:hypothetical protein [Gammaproteobacteria bacterium]
MAVRKMNFWGWGWADEAEIDRQADLDLARNLAETYGVDDIEPLTRPTVDDFDIPPRPTATAGAPRGYLHDR